ncbi:MAG: cell division FtsA domain-containing protein [Oscillospiraceae bacterium]
MENIVSAKEKNLIFALDIGTRSVVGVVGTMTEDGFEVVDYEQRFHAKRAMRDGQIEDISLVAKVIDEVKRTLEERLNVKFEKVSIAAAGRSLKTIKITYNQTVDPADEISKKLMQGAEYSALSRAMEEFAEQDEGNKKFHCVGYSVVRSALDDYDMSNLVGHKGNQITLEVIAAFLPHNVVEGLYATMTLNGLEVENLTLEPMAAIHVIVPKDIRLLNIALVDIGAGTSDIAICRNGGISAYDMVTVAGDELTEKLMQTYLVDFDEAEKIKMSLGEKGESTVFTDVLGFENILSKAELQETLQEPIFGLAQTISQRILEVNATSPVAVFIVGGGSQVPGLCEGIAQNLKLPQHRVTVGGRQGFKYVKLCSDKLQSPEFVTPIGIGAIISERTGADFFAITVNGSKIMLLRQGEIKVMEAILLAGIKPTALIGVPQRPINYTVDGKKYTFRQEYTSGEITINGKLASIDSMLTRGDALVVVPAKMSEKESVTAGDILKTIEPISVTLKGESYTLPVEIKVNGKRVEESYRICNDDVVTTSVKDTVGDLCAKAQVSPKGKIFAINGVDAQTKDILTQGDSVEYLAVDMSAQEQSQQSDMEQSKGQAQGQSQEQSQEQSRIPSQEQSRIPSQEQSRIPSQEPKIEQSKLTTEREACPPTQKKVAVHIKLTPQSAARKRNAYVYHNSEEKSEDSGAKALQMEREQSDKSGGEQTSVKVNDSEVSDEQKSAKLNDNKVGGEQTIAQGNDSEVGDDTKKDVDTQRIAEINFIKTSYEDNVELEHTSKENAIGQDDPLQTQRSQGDSGASDVVHQPREKGYIFVKINNIPTRVKTESDGSVLFVNMLNYINITNEAPGENLVLSINSLPASYTDVVRDGDDIIIRWE